MNQRHEHFKASLTKRSLITWVVLWAVHVGLWLIYTSQVNLWEIAVGAAAAGLSTLGVYVFGRLGLVKFRPSLGEVAEIWRLPWYAVTGTWELMQGIGRQLFTRGGAPSYLAAVRFEAGPDNPANCGRCALALLYGTMTPNLIVLGVVPEQKLLLYHQIIPGEVLPMMRNLGVKA